MEPFISNDSFDAFRTPTGIEIHEKKAAAKKFSLVILIVGLLFFAVGLIPMEGVTYKWIALMFTAVFFYGGIVLFALGLLVLILKGTGNQTAPITILNRETRTMTQRGKEIPFSEMEEVTIQTTDVMHKKMTALLFKHNGKRKGLVSGTVISEDVKSLETFVTEVNAIIKNE